MKASIVAASAALVGSVAAVQHNAHAGFHMRRAAYAEPEEICTVYTTVYVTGLPSIAPNSTIYEPSPVPQTSSSCTEELKTSIFTPPVVYSTKVPETSKQVYPPAPVPESSKAVYPPVPVVESSKPVPKPSTPAYPIVESSKPAPVPSAPAYTPEPYPSKPAETPVQYPSKPAETPVQYSSKPVETPVQYSSKPAETPIQYPSKPVETPVQYSTKPVETPKPVPSSSKPADTPKPVPSSSKSADKPKATGSYNEGGRIKINGNKWGMTYTPYAADGNCKSADEVKSDIKIIADLGFTTIRSYSTDCGVFENVVPECEKYGLKVIYGVFLEAGGKGGKGCFSDYANKQVQDIIDHAPKAGIAMVIVGNECMFNGNCQPAELASYIDYVRTQLQGAGFPKDIAITTTEPVGVWEEKGAALCDHIDVFACQVHPYFTATVTAEMAGDFAASQLEQAAKVCPEAAKKGRYISEIGWPSAGQNNGVAVASVEQQKIAMQKILEKVGSESTVFSFKDDPWKHPGNLGVEQHFGCIDVLS